MEDVIERGSTDVGRGIDDMYRSADDLEVLGRHGGDFSDNGNFGSCA